jgi:hypothetical protein
MTNVSFNPANGVSNAAIPNDSNSFTQPSGLDGLLAQPTFTFDGSNDINNKIDSNNGLYYHDPDNPSTFDKIRGWWDPRRQYQDSDHDGVPNHMDRFRGGDDKAPHHHFADGTGAVQNPNGTWTFYDANGNKIAGEWKLVKVEANTGGSVGGNASRDGGGFTVSSNGNNYTFTPVR